MSSDTEDSQEPGAAPGAAWPRGTIVSISRLAGGGQAMARALGLGELANIVDVGRSLHIRLDSGRALALSAVQQVETIDEATLRIHTSNHRYELRRVPGGAPSHEGLFSLHDGTRLDPSSSADSGQTQVVLYEPELDSPPGSFEQGAKVRASRLSGGQRHDLGISCLLSDLAPGEPLRIATPGGVVGTSAVLKISRVEDGAVELSTANSAYRLELEPDLGSGGSPQ